MNRELNQQRSGDTGQCWLSRSVVGVVDRGELRDAKMGERLGRADVRALKEQLEQGRWEKG